MLVTTLTDMTVKQFSQFSQSQVDAIRPRVLKDLNNKQRRALGLSPAQSRSATRRQRHTDGSAAPERRVIEALDVDHHLPGNSRAETEQEAPASLNPVMLENEGW